MSITIQDLATATTRYASKLQAAKSTVDNLAKQARPISSAAADQLEKIDNPLPKLAFMRSWSASPTSSVAPEQLAERVADIVGWLAQNPSRVIEVLVGLGVGDEAKVTGMIGFVSGMVPKREKIIAMVTKELTKSLASQGVQAAISGAGPQIQAEYAKSRAKLVEYIAGLSPAATAAAYAPLGIALTPEQATKLMAGAKADMEKMLVNLDEVVGNIVAGKHGDVVAGLDALISEVVAMAGVLAQISDVVRTSRAASAA